MTNTPCESTIELTTVRLTVAVSFAIYLLANLLAIDVNTLWISSKVFVLVFLLSGLMALVLLKTQNFSYSIIVCYLVLAGSLWSPLWLSISVIVLAGGAGSLKLFNYRQWKEIRVFEEVKFPCVIAILIY